MGLQNFKIIIQDGDGWIRVIMNGAIVIEGPEITCRDLKELFSDMGFDCKLQHGVFPEGVKDKEGDDAFHVQHEER